MDFPDGRWSALLVGHQWPSSTSLATLISAARSRAGLGAAHDRYGDLQQSIRTDLLATQEGVTAQDSRAAFHHGEARAREIALRNATKHSSYLSGSQWVTELRADLTTIATDGGAEIEATLNSTKPLPEKIAAITQTVVMTQGRANAKAAECSANLFGAIQRVLDTADPGVSAREFALSRGVDLSRSFGAPRTPQVRDQITHLINGPVDQPASTSALLDTSAVEHSPSSPTNAVPQAPAGRSVLSADAVTRSAETGSGSDTGLTDTVARPSAGVALFIEAPASETAPGRTPAEATGPPATPPIEPRHPPVAAPTAPAIGISSPSGAYSSSSISSRSISTAVQGPPVPGPLPAYGADLRPSAAATPPAPLTSPVTAPGSAAATTAIPSGGVGRPVVRRQPLTARSPSPATTTERALAEAGIVLATGAGGLRGPAEDRLRRLLHAVARQQPELRWAITELADGGLVLVTDLSGGWIPPNIDIPTGLQLLQPTSHRDAIVALLGLASATATYRPGEQLDPTDDALAIPTSMGARDVTGVDDLGWELSQVARWRDGLPRLAHTLARAAATGTGCLQSEIDLLSEHLALAGRNAVARYPRDISPAEVGNWQLLATIDALVNSNKHLADYHFAWFRAQMLLETGDRSR